MSNRYQFHILAIINSTIASVVLAVALLLPKSAFGIGFQPVNPDELKMTKEPLAPGAPAIILFRQVDRDDNGRTSHEDNYYRIKILTEEGVKYANIEIPFFKERGNNVVAIHARSIRPDGTIAEFDGKIFEKTIVKARGLKYLAETLTLPDVKVGSIIEYNYTYDLAEFSLFESHWILSDELFTKSARFSLKPYVGSFENPFRLSWTWQRLPTGTQQPKEGADKIIRMDASNIPAFPTEDFMPPENELKSRVDFNYSEDAPEKDAESFWRKVGKQRNATLESFIGKRKAMEDAVGQIISPTDAPELKLRKIYDRVQQIRNTSYEIQKTEQEQKREKEKAVNNVEEIWKRGYGDGTQLTWLYLALVRAAGFDAYGCWVSDRSNYFFTPTTMQKRKLNANVVLVKLNGKDLYFDPGAAFTPFGLLTWAETGVAGMRLDKDGGTWIQTTLPLPSESQIHREAKLKLSDTGDLEGVVTVTYTGLEGMYRRLEERHEDETARKKYLEDLLKDQIPAASELELTNKPDWSSAKTPLVADFSLKIPGWASSAGKRAMLPVGFFTAHEKRIFEHANRVHPIYFEYPYEKLDDVTVELPPGWQVTSVPPPQAQDGHVLVYELKAEDGKGSVHVVRELDFDLLLLEAKYYPALRNFFQAVRTGDEQQILIQPSPQSASN
jgi:hypothetical protein